jgi:type IV secretory pathway VirJ component
MRHPVRAATALAVAGILLAHVPARATEETIVLGRLGTVTLYHQSPRPSHVVLFVSGDGGWNLGVVDMARELASLDALVAGVDITHYLRELDAATTMCSYPAADFEMLAKAIEQRLWYPAYVTPILAGYSSGATLVYAMLVQAPPNTFAGALSLGFCPDLDVTHPLCRGEGLESSPGPKGKGVVFLPVKRVERPWTVFQGTIDQVCDPPSTEAFVRGVEGAKLVMLPKVGHGFSVPANWMPQFRAAFKEIVTRTEPVAPAREDELSDLPLHEFPAEGAATTDLLALHLSGDGGYGVTDRGLSESLAEAGIPVVGLNSLAYFWSARSPEATASDVARILRHFLAAWGKERAILVGYSFGADVLPFVVNRLPADLAARVPLVALVGPDHEAEFEFHVSDWFSGRSHPGAFPVLPELEKVKGPRVLCLHGSQEEGSLCPDCPAGLVEDVPLEGGHRVHRNFRPIAEAIVRDSR